MNNPFTRATYLLGLDIGSSSIKAALVHAESRATLRIVQSPAQSMLIHAPHPGWAEQDPESWWKHVCIATNELFAETGIDPAQIKGIGIAYQMHGLVCVDENLQALRPSIIWCDSRAVEIGDKAFDEIGRDICLSRLLNSPGNFTASKLAWVKTNEPDIYSRIYKIMLPGDYIALKLTGELCTTPAGLSEGMFWDFESEAVSKDVMSYFGFDPALIPQVRPVFSLQGAVRAQAAAETGLIEGTPVAYRAGDQPNNALSLGVFRPGEVAGTGGTSGVVYGVVDRPAYDKASRINSFLHINHQHDAKRIGILLCINGVGSQYSWVKETIAPPGVTFAQMGEEALTVPAGSDGVLIYPFGNGAERMLGNRLEGARIANLDFNRHTRAHLYRAALEGVAFSFVYGIGIMHDMGLRIGRMRVGNDNMFQSAVFSSAIATLTGSPIDVVETTGAAGAAKAAGLATGIYASYDDVAQGLEIIKTYEPAEGRIADRYKQGFGEWVGGL